MVTNANPAFPNILAECLEALERNEWTFEQCLSEYPEYWDELYTLLTTAQHLKAAPEVPPSFDFSYEARARLLKRLPSRTPRADIVLFDSLQRAWKHLIQPLRIRRLGLQWAAIVALLLSLFGGGTLAYAFSDSLPGDTLYPVKLALEEVRLAVSFDEAGDVALRMEFATNRLNEATTLIQQNRETEAAQTLQAYTAEVQSAMETLRRVPEAQTGTLSQQIEQTASQHDQVLSDIASQAPAEAQSALNQAITASSEIRHNASAQPTTAPATVEAVIAAPTDSPTLVPTPQPTETVSTGAEVNSVQPVLPQPTAEPPTTLPATSEPVADPLQVATPIPTLAPTQAPAEAPTDSPTTAPAQESPTLLPPTLLSPTPELPTQAPTSSGLLTETAQPSGAPTLAPTESISPTPPATAVPSETAAPSTANASPEMLTTLPSSTPLPSVQPSQP